MVASPFSFLVFYIILRLSLFASPNVHMFFKGPALAFIYMCIFFLFYVFIFSSHVLLISFALFFFLVHKIEILGSLYSGYNFSCYHMF